MKNAMSQVLFNQFAYTDRLTRGGFTPEQARASAEALETAFTETVATKSDLDRLETALKTDIDRVQTTLKTEIATVETGLKAEIAATEARLDAKIAATETRLVSEIHSTGYKGVGLLAAVMGLAALAAKFWK